jgi:integrase
MPHFPKPFFRSARQCWFVEIDGKQTKLCPDRHEALRLYGELMAKPRAAKLASDSIAVLMDIFLDWTEQHRPGRTYEWYRERCQGFLDAIPATLTIRELKPFYVQQWVDTHRWNDGMKRGAMIAVKRAFNWLAKQGHIDRSPITGLELPPQGHRERVITPDEYKSILARYEGDPFADLLELAWDTGARAQELWKLEARHVQGAAWVFPAKEAKGKRRPRIIHLTDKALAITQRLMMKYPTGKLLRNEDGVPWTRHAVSCRFLRLKKKIGEKLCLTNFRHTFCSHALMNGVDGVVVSKLMGHTSTRMIETVYGHLTAEFLQGALKKATA